MGIQISKKQQTHIPEIDIAKGLGILSVILYHALPASAMHTAIGGYVMPLFFLLAGLVLHREHRFSFAVFWKENTRLLLYYILFSTIYLLCGAITCLAGGGSYKTLVLDGIATLVGCGFNVFWFLSALFLGKLLCQLFIGSPLPRWAQGLFLAGLFLLAAGVGKSVDFTALSGVHRVLGMVGLTVLRPMEAAFYLFIGVLLQGAFRSLRDRCAKPATAATCGIGGAVLTVGCCLLAQAATQDMHYLTASRPMLSLAAAMLGCTGILGISLGLCRIRISAKALAYFGMHSLYLMAIHNQPNLYGWLQKLVAALCTHLPALYAYLLFWIVLVFASMAFMQLTEPWLDPAIRMLASRCTQRIKSNAPAERP